MNKRSKNQIERALTLLTTAHRLIDQVSDDESIRYDKLSENEQAGDSGDSGEHAKLNAEAFFILANHLDDLREEICEARDLS